MSRAELFIEARHRLGESIIWHVAERCLYWIDLLEPELFRCNIDGGSRTGHPLPLKPPIGAIAATADPRKLFLSHRGGVSLVDTQTLAIEAWADPEAGRDAIISNDMKCDRWGRLWVGSSHEFEREARGALWCLTSRGRAVLGDAGFAVSNGPAFSPDGRTMYFSDSGAAQILAYDIAPDDPHPRNRRLFRKHGEGEGVPDGLVVDSEGCIWVAHWGGACVTRLSPGGEVIARHAVPALNVTAVCHAGDGLKTLFVVTARDQMDEAALARFPLSGSLFRLDTDVAGLAEPLGKLT